MGLVMAAHQPNFMPYLGFFDKMMNSDVFIIRDEVQFAKRDWHHRNQIRIQGYDSDGQPKSDWIRVPVDKSEINLMEKKIKNDVKDRNVPWYIAMLRQIRGNYEGAKGHFDEYFPEVEKTLSNHHENLVDLNMDLIRFLIDAFGIKKEVIMASEINNGQKSGDASQDLVDLIRAVGADTYLSGSGGKKYMDMEPFNRANIPVIFQDFKHPVYQQRWDGFLPNMASIDALFNVGRYPIN